MELKINLYNRKVKQRFEKERSRILKVIKNCEIYHIGSTAVPGLGGKGIVDIMIGIKNWKESASVIKKLRKLGFNHIHPKEKGRIFLSKNTSLSLDNVHIHIVKTGSKIYKEVLFFRDFLRKNKKEAKNYNNLKIKWFKDTKGNREKYKELKAKYIKEVLNSKL